MNVRRKVVAGIAIALLLGAGTAYADGVGVLDLMEGTVVTLENAVTSARQTEGASFSGIKKAEKAIDSFEEAIEALRAHDMDQYRKHHEKAIGRLMKAEDRLGPTFLPPDGSETHAVMLRATNLECKSLVDLETGIGPGAERSGDKNLSKGDKKAARGKWDDAAERYLKGIKGYEDVPMPVPGSHMSVLLRALDGAPLNIGIAVVPYSPKQTCGACHDYDLITQGFHFDQGREAVRDDYSAGTSSPDYVLSDGMYGRW